MDVSNEFYISVYGGVEVDHGLLTRLIKRASRDIESLTGFNLDFDNLSEKSQELVRLAICAQVEFLAINGETASTVANDGGSFSIGSYSESSSGRNGTKSQIPQSRYSASVKEYLLPTGLLYGGVMRRG